MIYFLSDSHIGSRALDDWKAHQQQVVDRLLSLKQDATAIYLLGDIFDYWYEYFFGKPKGYEPMLDALRNLTDSGIEVHFFTGNHDMWTFGWLQKRTGVRIHRKPYDAVINGKRCLLAHGDRLVPSYIMDIYPKPVRKKIKKFMRLQAFFHNPVAQFFYRFMPPSLGDWLGFRWTKHSREKELANFVGYKGEQQEELVLFAKEQEQTVHHDFYIFGHRHIELDLELSGGSRVLILGDMFRYWTYARMDDAGNVQMLNFE